MVTNFFQILENDNEGTSLYVNDNTTLRKFSGYQDVNLKTLEKISDVRINLRGNLITLKGKSEKVKIVVKTIDMLLRKTEGKNNLEEEDIKSFYYFEQKKQIDRSEIENNFSLNPSLFESGDTIYSPFITSRKNTISLLENALGIKVEFKMEELKDYNVLNSSQVDDVYSAILKDSDNLISESITANISFRLNDTISVDKGVKLIKRLSKQIELFDGSGLSRYNLVTPKSIISSLHDIYNLVGFDRIKKIFPKNYIIQDKEDFVWGRTGTLKNNHNYSGYLITDKNRIYIFSIMINHFTNDLSKITEAIVDFLIYLKSNS